MGTGLTEGCRQLVRRLCGRGFFGQVAILVGGTAFAQALTVLVTPVLTRLYQPDDYGVLAVYVSLLSFPSVVASLRYEYAIPLPKDKVDAANTLALALAIVVGLSAVAGVVAWFLRDYIVGWTQTPTLAPYMWLVGLGVLWSGTYRALTYWAIRKQAFGRIARTRVSQGLGQVLIQLGMGLLHCRPLGLLVGSVVGQGAGSTTLGTLAWKQDQEALRGITWGGMRQVAWRYRRFPFFSATALLNIAGLRLPALLIAALFGAVVAGSFGVVMRVMGWPMQFIGGAIAQVYTGEAARLVRESPADLYALLMRTTRRLALIGLSVLGVGLLAPLFFSFVFGERWHEAGVYCQVLAPMLYAQFVVSPISALANIVERQDLQLYGDAVRASIVVGLFYLASRWHWTPVATLAGLSALMTLTYVAYFIMYATIARTAAAKAPPAHDAPAE